MLNSCSEEATAPVIVSEASSSSMTDYNGLSYSFNPQISSSSFSINISSMTSLSSSSEFRLSSSDENISSSSASLISSSSIVNDVILSFSTITDSRDNNVYKTVTINGVTWMAENLKYKPLIGNYWCLDNDTSMCDKYGVLYDWAATMAVNETYNSIKLGEAANYQGVCPDNWHIPTLGEFNNLISVAGGEWEAASKLKSLYDWRSISGIENTDEFGFNALPGGFTYAGLSWNYNTWNGIWWTASESEAYSYAAYNLSLSYASDFAMLTAGNKQYGISVRCIMN